MTALPPCLFGYAAKLRLTPDALTLHSIFYYFFLFNTFFSDLELKLQRTE